MRFLLLSILIPVSLMAQPGDTTINGKEYFFITYDMLEDSTVLIGVVERLKSIGEPDGEYLVYSSNGALMEKGTYRKGRKEGKWITYFQDGNTASVSTFHRGHAIGDWTWYHPNGAVKGKSRYVQKRILKKKKIGSIAQTQFWTPKRYYPWFEIQIHATAVDSFVEYYPDSQVKVRLRFDDDGMRIDSAEFFYPSGQLNCVQYWSGNYGTGCWRYYCPDGSVSHYQSNSGSDSIVCPLPDGEYADCYYEVDHEIDWYQGRSRAKF
jgi:antitoxin component YwqK of YwqJK toxin-antitoxin module